MKPVVQQFVNKRRTQSGFTLLELIVVIAILAIIAGALLAAYDGLEKKAGRSQASFNASGVDRAVRTFKVLSGNFPDQLDNVYVGANPVDILAPEFVDETDLLAYTLTVTNVTALNRAGITTLMTAPTHTLQANLVVNNQLVNRAFDTAPNGVGVSTAIANGTTVAQIGNTNLLKSLANLGRLGDVVIALGLGQSSTIVKPTSSSASGFAAAPFFTNVKRNEYGRFFLLFQLVSDDNNNGVPEPIEALNEARFVGVLDSLGNIMEENALGNGN